MSSIWSVENPVWPALWPHRHPQVDVSHTTNEVRNASDDGCTTSEQI